MCLACSLPVSLIVIVLNCKSQKRGVGGGRGRRIIFQKVVRAIEGHLRACLESITVKKVRHGCGHPC
jgi:hypothetical protein